MLLHVGTSKSRRYRDASLPNSRCGFFRKMLWGRTASALHRLDEYHLNRIGISRGAIDSWAAHQVDPLASLGPTGAPGRGAAKDA